MKNQRHASECYFCGLSTTHTVIVEDGTPFYHPMYFDSSGLVPVCADWQATDGACQARRRELASVDARREERERIRAQALEQAQGLLRSVLTDRVGALLRGLAHTGYQPYDSTRALQKLTRIMDIPSLPGLVRLPNGCGVTEIYRSTEGYVSRFQGVCYLWAMPRTCDEYRRQWAATHGVTPDHAAGMLASPNIGDDQRRMYQCCIADLPPEVA